MILTSTLVTKRCEASPTGEALTRRWFSVSALPQVMLHQHHFPVAWSTLTTACPLPHEAAVIRLGHDILGLSPCIFILTYLMTIQFWIFFFFLQRWHPATHGILWLTSFLLDNMSWYLSVTGPVADAYSFHCFMMFQAGHTVFHLSPSMHEHADYTPRGFALINHTAMIRVFLHT